MTFLTPTPFKRALAFLRGKRLVPTWLSSKSLRDLDGQVRSQALFSARMTQLRPLQALQAVLTAMLSNEANLADAKLALGRVYASMGYDSEKGGFPQDEPGKVPPALRGSLRDLASEQRMELTITTQYRMAANLAFVEKGMTDQRRYQYPCLELVRIAGRRTPRGFKRGRSGGLEPQPGDDWPSRFLAAGGELYDRGTRMIALKSSDVWVKLGEGAGGYEDTLGNPFAPFAFGSGYGLREVPRQECLLLGVIQPDEQAAKMPVTLAKALKADAAKLDPGLLAAFKKDLVTREDGTVRLKRMLESELKAAETAYRGNRQPLSREAFKRLVMPLFEAPKVTAETALQRRCKALLKALYA